MEFDLLRIMTSVSAVLIILMGLLTGTIGLLGLKWRRPIFIRTIYYYGPLIVMIIASYSYFIFQPFISPYILDDNIIYTYGVPIFFSVMIVFMVVLLVRQSAGYMITGITEDLHEALINTFREKNIEIEMKLTSIKLVEAEAKINVALAKWMGTAQLQIDPITKSKLLDEIVDLLQKYYKSNKCAVNVFSLVLYLIMGFVFVIGGIFIIILLNDLLLSIVTY